MNDFKQDKDISFNKLDPKNWKLNNKKEGSFQCPDCEEIFNTKNLRKKHRREVHGIECPHCKKMVLKNKIKSHINRYHALYAMKFAITRGTYPNTKKNIKVKRLEIVLRHLIRKQRRKDLKRNISVLIVKWSSHTTIISNMINGNACREKLILLFIQKIGINQYMRTLLGSHQMGVRKGYPAIYMNYF